MRGIALLLSLCAIPATASADGLSDSYENDIGIASDPAVVFADDFETDVDTIAGHWGNSSGAQSVVDDAPLASGGQTSLQLDGDGSGSTLYKRLSQNYDQLYVRYYVKYDATSYHHTGAYVGGYNPASDWPMGDAGIKGIRDDGSRLIHIGFETAGFSEPYRLDFYANWVDMQGLPYEGLYYGRNFVSDLDIAIPQNEWLCVEIMTKVNSAAVVKDGELALWIDDVLMEHFKPGQPNGSWTETGGWSMNDSGPGFEGFLWRDTVDYALNWVKIQNYDAGANLAWFDDLVVATERVGCVNDGAAPAAPTSPTDAGGCGCSTSSPSPTGPLLLLLVVTLGHRRRSLG